MDAYPLISDCLQRVCAYAQSVSDVIPEAMRTWLRRERRLAALDEAPARGIGELVASAGQDAEGVREELLEELASGNSDVK